MRKLQWREKVYIFLFLFFSHYLRHSSFQIMRIPTNDCIPFVGNTVQTKICELASRKNKSIWKTEPYFPQFLFLGRTMQWFQNSVGKLSWKIWLNCFSFQNFKKDLLAICCTRGEPGHVYRPCVTFAAKSAMLLC